MYVESKVFVGFSVSFMLSFSKENGNGHFGHFDHGHVRAAVCF